MEWQELGLTALRASIIYVVLLVVIRLLGKRTIGISTAFDFMVALILGEVVDEPIYGDVPLVQGLLVIGVIAGWQYVHSWLACRSERLDRLTGGGPTLLIRDGVLDRQAMAAEHMNEAELWSLLRQHEIERLSEVKRATLEPNGEVSVLRTEESRELRKRDLVEALRRTA